MPGLVTVVTTALSTVREAIDLRDRFLRLIGRPPLRILSPGGECEAREFVEIAGDGCPRGWRVFVVSSLVHHRSWIQPADVEPDPNGEWVHPRCQLYVTGERGERYVYALAVKEKEADIVRAWVGRPFSGPAEVEQLLSSRRIRRKWSKRKRLIRIPDLAPR
jgi:hypothetical protein